MTTHFRDRIFSPLAKPEAEALVRELDRIIDEAQPTEADDAATTTEPPPELDGLTVHTTRQLREEADDGALEAAERDARRRKKKKPRTTRAAKQGEVEAVAIHRTLVAHLEDGGPLERAALREALRGASDDVRTYAAALIEEGAHADARLAKVLDRSAKAIATARTELARLLEAVADD